MGGKPQPGVAVVLGVKPGLRPKQGRRRAPPQREWCSRRRPSRTRYGWTSRSKRAPEDGNILDDEQLFIFDSESRHLLRVSVINDTVDGFHRKRRTKANGIHEVSDGLSRKVLDVDICVGYSGYLVSWELPTFPERLSQNRS